MARLVLVCKESRPHWLRNQTSLLTSTLVILWHLPTATQLIWLWINSVLQNPKGLEAASHSNPVNWTHKYRRLSGNDAGCILEKKLGSFNGHPVNGQKEIVIYKVIQNCDPNVWAYSSEICCLLKHIAIRINVEN